MVKVCVPLESSQVGVCARRFQRFHSAGVLWSIVQITLINPNKSLCRQQGGDLA